MIGRGLEQNHLLAKNPAASLTVARGHEQPIIVDLLDPEKEIVLARDLPAAVKDRRTGRFQHHGRSHGDGALPGLSAGGLGSCPAD